MPAPTLHRIDNALAVLAEIISHHGDVYWPIFERLERERESLVSREKRLNTARYRIQKDALQI